MPRGRPAGSLDRNKAFLIKRLQEMYGEDFDPVMQMAGHAYAIKQLLAEKGDVTSDEHVQAINAWDKIAQYTNAKLKSMEVDVTSGGEPISNEYHIHPVTTKDAPD